VDAFDYGRGDVWRYPVAAIQVFNPKFAIMVV
jgi:hypothetical protein